MSERNGGASGRLGFLGLYETGAEDGYIGAILITDPHGIPQEFRCTLPIKPTAIQKPLYGDSMEPYIGVELCGKPLMQSVQHPPSLLLVNREFLLDVRQASGCPVVFVRQAGEAIDVEPADTSDVGVKRERLDCPTGRFQPIVFSVHPEYYDEDGLSAREMLEKVFRHLEPGEPFERAARAIVELARQDKRFQ